MSVIVIPTLPPKKKPEKRRKKEEEEKLLNQNRSLRSERVRFSIASYM
jgi:hypothetical protein